MAEGKKISFGFSKISKKPTVVAPKKEESEIQFIDCLEGNSIKLINGEEKVKEALVIPLKNGNILRDNMIEALKARKEENSTKNGIIKNENVEVKEDSSANTVSSECESEKKPLTLDELAAKEILEDLKKTNESETVKDIREIPTTNAASLGEKESTLEDYENIPVNEFGLAMLRGMGWAPDKGIGKNGQIVEPLNPVVRPKGMGLGADKALPTVTRTASGEELVMKKNAPLKIISGPYKNLYAKVEGFDELPGRIMVRLTLQNSVISISENLVQLVTSEEFNKNSKILNLNDYNKYYEEKQPKNDKPEASKMSIKIEPGRPVNESDQVNKKVKSEYNERNRSEDHSRKERRVSSDSEEHFIEKRERLDKRKKDRYEKEIDSRYRGRSPSSEPEEKYQRSKTKREHRSPSSSSEDRRKTKSHKKKRRERSSSSDYDDKKQKDKNSHKSESKGHSSHHSKKKSKHKKSNKDSSDSEVEKKSSKKHGDRSHKHSKKVRNYSDSESDDREKRRKHYSKQRSNSRSPSRKKKSKHHRSRS